MVPIEEHKSPQHNIASEKFLTPKKLYLPLSQHIGAPSVACIEMGSEVEERGVIAKEAGYISARLHAPASGKFLGLENWAHPNLKRAPAMVIQAQEKTFNYSQRKGIETLTNQELLEIIKNNGIVGMGGAAFPTHVKLKPPKRIDTLIINGCECEPYLATDYRLMVENLNDIFKGIEIISRLTNPKKIIFAIEENKPAAIKKINLAVNTKKFDLPQMSVVILKSRYPQGGEKQLIQATTKRKILPQKLPLDVGCLVHNVATCFAIYEAIYFNKPLIERLVSFCGDALVAPKNIWVKIGTTLKELFDNKILELKKEPKKIICGGPMMGIALNNLDYPILKASGGYLFLEKEAIDSQEKPCIRCGRCIDVCPMNLMPLEYPKRVKNDDFEPLGDFNIADCIECGCCAYACPAKIPIVHYVKLGKTATAKLKK